MKFRGRASALPFYFRENYTPLYENIHIFERGFIMNITVAIVIMVYVGLTIDKIMHKNDGKSEL